MQAGGQGLQAGGQGSQFQSQQDGRHEAMDPGLFDSKNTNNVIQPKNTIDSNAKTDNSNSLLQQAGVTLLPNGVVSNGVVPNISGIIPGGIPNNVSNSNISYNPMTMSGAMPPLPGGVNNIHTRGRGAKGVNMNLNINPNTPNNMQNPNMQNPTLPDSMK